MQLDRVARVIPTGRLGNPKSLPDDVLKVRVGYESAAGSRKAPRQAVWGTLKRGAPSVQSQGGIESWGQKILTRLVNGSSKYLVII